jgi:hypothetical protein
VLSHQFLPRNLAPYRAELDTCEDADAGKHKISGVVSVYFCRGADESVLLSALS